MDAGGAVSLLVLAMGAFLIPLLSERARIPAVVGEILFGMAISHGALDVMSPTPFTRFLAQFGFALLMFLAGMEIDFTKVERMSRRALLACAGAAAGAFSVGLAATLLFGRPLFLVLVIGAMSLGLVLAALRALDLTQRPVGQVVLLVGTLGEFLTLILLTVGDIAAVHGIGVDLVQAVGKLVLVFGLAWICLLGLRMLIWWFPDAFVRVVATRDASEIGVRASLALMTAFVAVAALLGVETILGAFLAGALFSFVFREKHVVETKLASLGFGFFIPIFFIDVGMSFDLGGFAGAGTWKVVGFLAAASLAAKLLPALLLTLAGLRLRQALAGGLLLAAPLTLLVAESRIGLHIGAIDARTAAAIVLFAVAGGIVFPTLFRLIVGRAPGPADGRRHERA
ncbi:MAG: cation:proton antiporter [Deltaproteobacteria bacterium]|nr:cation:proton antiporter [Deltaproteobacteria bacterium]